MGEHLLLGDGAGGLVSGEVVEVGRDSLRVRVERRWREPGPTPSVTLVQALVKGDRGELAVELATEAGIDEIVPWRASRCVARWEDGARGEKALRRWQATVASAAKQSRRAWVPRVHGPAGTGEVADRCAAADLALVLHESADARLTDLGVELAEASEVVLVVGPEGGITDDELARLEARGALGVRLGPQVLRASTAAAVALGALGVLTRRWRATD
jgi:16S rRNA (uracil1498-N3)-methyltransferase